MRIMKIYLDNNNFYYETEKLAKVFFPNTKFEEIHQIPEKLVPPYIFIAKCCDDGEEDCKIRVAVCIDDFHKSGFVDVADNSEEELLSMRTLYDILVTFTGVTPPWGLLTGVRPIKLFRKLKEENPDRENENDVQYAIDKFKNIYRVSPEKTALAAETEKTESEILKLTSDNSFSLYLAIPFCPTRCSYCSFVSSSVKQAKKLIEPYTQLLCREIEETSKMVKELGLHLESVYMGGGTPTTLSAEQMTRVLSTVNKCFDMSGCREFTVEAGRPDTVTFEKLLAIKSAGVDRISINPQTLDDKVLENIGRKHSAKDIYSAFDKARELGFDHINMDLIAGLPGDTEAGFKKTLDKVIELSPESITVHTLAMKRAAEITLSGKHLDKKEAQTAAAMVSYSTKALRLAGYHPYYLYRQSRMAGNLENTGWSKPGKEGYYNVFIMEETQTIISCGAGAVTKLCSDEGTVERIFNYKYPYEYIDRFAQLLDRKKGIKDFYD